MSESDWAGFGTRVRKFRKKKGLTQQHLGGPHYTAAFVSQIEAGKRRPSPKALLHLANQLQITTEELLTGRSPALETELELQVQEAGIAISNGRYEEGLASLDRAARDASKYKFPRIEAEIVELRGVAAERQNDFQQALEFFHQADDLTKEWSITERIGPLSGVSRCSQALGNPHYAVYLLESYLRELNERIADPTALMRTYSALIGAYFAAGFREKAVAAAAEALRLSPSTDDISEVACMNIQAARALLVQGKSGDALDALRRARDLYDRLGWKVELARANTAQGIVLTDKGELDDAKASLGSALELLDGTSAVVDQARTLNELGRVERLAGRTDSALGHLERAQQLLSDGDLLERALNHREIGLCYRDSGPDRATEQLKEAADLYRRAGNSVEVASTFKALGDLQHARGDLQASADLYRQGIEEVEERAS